MLAARFTMPRENATNDTLLNRCRSGKQSTIVQCRDYVVRYLYRPKYYYDERT
jgi:hypothetical protein